MLMTPLTDQQIEKLMKSDKGNLAERILSSGRIWKFADRLDQSIETGDNPNSRPVPAGMAGAYVLEGGSEPYKILWNGDGWNCECASHSVGSPCVHLAALLLKLAGKRPDDLRLPASDAAEVDSRLDPEQDLLFFVEPEELKLKPVMVLGRDAEVASLWTKAIPPAPGEPEGPLIKDLSGQTWRVSPATVAERADGHEGPAQTEAIGRSGAGIIPSTNPAGHRRRHTEGQKVDCG
jgi:hypothetical protein